MHSLLLIFQYQKEYRHSMCVPDPPADTGNSGYGGTLSLWHLHLPQTFDHIIYSCEKDHVSCFTQAIWRKFKTRTRMQEACTARGGLRSKY